MAKYDSALTELKNLLPTAKNILIALPAGGDIDRWAAGLALFLSLSSQGKEVSIVSEDTPKVGQSHLFGIDHVKNDLPKTNGGNLILTLEGVAVPDGQGGKVPALEKLDYYVENNNLNLLFKVLPGQTFQPARIVPHYQGSGFNLIFVIGAVNLNSLGNIYVQNQQAFSGIHLVNIDNQAVNTSFGQTNIVDQNAASLSEMMISLISGLSLPLDNDTATNLLNGIFESTANLTGPKVNADTYLAVANCLQAGGKKPQPENPSAIPGGGFDWSVLMPQSQPTPQPSKEAFTVPPVVSSEAQSQPELQQVQTENQPSPEERPSGEGVVTEAEPDWLRPKVFKGSSLG